MVRTTILSVLAASFLIAAITAYCLEEPVPTDLLTNAASIFSTPGLMANVEHKH